MKNIPLIIGREYLSRIKKKSFIIMTLVSPILMAALFIVPIWLAMSEDKTKKEIDVYLLTDSLKPVFQNTETLSFHFVNEPDDSVRKADFLQTEHYALLTMTDTTGRHFNLYSEKSPDVSVKQKLGHMIEEYLESGNLQKLGVSKKDLESAKVDVLLNTYVISEEGDKASSAELTVAIGFIAAIVIYMFIFLYGSQVMRGVIEEKVNRVVEIVVSSVKPFELMAGKIVGIALVALTQFVLWIILTGVLVGAAYFFIGAEVLKKSGMENMPQMQGQVSSQDVEGVLSHMIPGNLIDVVFNFDWAGMLFTFLFFFMAGYLLYASLFAAIGSAVDNETDSNQFTLPVSVPLILAFIASQGIIKNPESPLAFWMSIIPFTSPIIMPIRVAIDRYAVWELLLSGGLLLLTFVGAIWFAAKIYRTGILMYGKKISYKEIRKWLKYK